MGVHANMNGMITIECGGQQATVPLSQCEVGDLPAASAKSKFWIIMSVVLGIILTCAVLFIIHLLKERTRLLRSQELLKSQARRSLKEVVVQSLSAAKAARKFRDLKSSKRFPKSSTKLHKLNTSLPKSSTRLPKSSTLRTLPKSSTRTRIHKSRSRESTNKRKRRHRS